MVLAVSLLALAPHQTVWASQITGLVSPQSMVADSGHGYFIANANGEPNDRINHGFITKVDQSGAIVAREFIQGGRGTTILHSPKEMAILADILFVADEDTIRGFNKSTGESVTSISMKRYHCTTLTGLAVDAHGYLYVSDTETNAIFRIDPSREFSVTLLAQDPLLSKPRGLAINPRSGRLMGVGWEHGTVFEVGEQGAIKVLLVNSFFSFRFYNLDGIDFDRYGSLYLSDLTAGKIWRIRSDFKKKEAIAEFLPSPSGIGIDRKNHVILVPYLYANAAEINGLERPVQAKGSRKKRTLADYGLGWLEKKGSP